MSGHRLSSLTTGQSGLDPIAHPRSGVGAGSRTALTFAEVTALPAVIDVMTAAKALGISRTTAYALARADEFPCPMLRVSGTYRIPTIGVLRILGLAPPETNQ